MMHTIDSIDARSEPREGYGTYGCLLSGAQGRRIRHQVSQGTTSFIGIE